VNSMENIKFFAREKLGCGCSEDVFEYIDVNEAIKLDNGLYLKNRINIGNRLLIYTAEINDTDKLKTDLVKLIEIGKDERDSLNFNRFRMVVVTDNIEKIGESAEKIFTDSGIKDDKIHLHILGPDDVMV